MVVADNTSSSRMAKCAGTATVDDQTADGAVAVSTSKMVAGLLDAEVADSTVEADSAEAMEDHHVEARVARVMELVVAAAVLDQSSNAINVRNNKSGCSHRTRSKEAKVCANFIENFEECLLWKMILF